MARPRKAEQIDVPAKAIEKAIELLRRRTTAELTLKEVAEEVGCRAPALYHHFKNRDDLLRAVHDEGFERLYKQKLAAATRDATSGFERLRAGGIAYIAFALQNPSLYQLMFAPPPAQSSPADNPFERDLGLKSLAILRGSVVACQEEGYLSGADADLVAFTLWSTVHGAASLMLQDRSPLATTAASDPVLLAERTVDTMMTFVANTRSERQAS